jgi:non-specific protein-tyrosine kinase
MEIRELIEPLRRWWWLIVVSTLVAALSSLIVTLQQPPIYEARSTLMIGNTIEDPNPTTGQFTLAQQLAIGYADIANREPVRNATMEALGLTFLPQYLARAIPNSQMIDIIVTDLNPARAQAVANELGRQLILRSPTSGSPEDQARLQFINEQLDSLQNQIRDNQEQVQKLQAQLSELNSARQIAETQGQITALQNKLNTLQVNYASLLAGTQQGAINTLSVIEPAGLPVRPVGPDVLLTVLLAAAVGLTLATIAAYAIEFLDDSMKTAEQVARLTHQPVIGFIPDLPEATNKPAFVFENPRSPIADAYRTLRTNLEFAAVDAPLKTILIASSDTNEGKSTLASNLALIIAQTEKKVYLVDADLRKPVQHGLLNIPNDRGLSDVFRDKASLAEVAIPLEEKHIHLIPSGAIPPNPTELLGSAKMDKILQDLRAMADVIIIDGPPFVVPDASVLADKVDGVLVVIRPRYSRRGAVTSMVDQVNRVGARVIGVVLNRMPRSGDYYGAYYQRYTNPDEPAAGGATANGRFAPARERLLAWMKKFQARPESEEELEKLT